MQRLRIKIEKENGEFLDEIMVYDETTLTEDEAENLDFDPDAVEISEVDYWIKKAFKIMEEF
jgi:hypothetical protein